MKLPKVIGHRGVRGYAPENTLVGFHTAADMGLQWVEFDVKLTKDGIPIVFHDDNFTRITGLDGKVADHTYDDIKEMDAGRHFSESFIGEPIPNLEDVLDVCIDRGLNINMEIKPCPGREVETAEVALDYLSRCWPDDYPLPLISSFKYPCLETAYDMASGWPRGFLIDESEERDENWRKMLEYLRPSTINCNGNAATDEQILEYLEYELPVLSYTINDVGLAHDLYHLGVTSVFSDYPDTIIDSLD